MQKGIFRTKIIRGHIQILYLRIIYSVAPKYIIMICLSLYYENVLDLIIVKIYCLSLKNKHIFTVFQTGIYDTMLHVSLFSG